MFLKTIPKGKLQPITEHVVLIKIFIIFDSLLFRNENISRSELQDEEKNYSQVDLFICLRIIDPQQKRIPAFENICYSEDCCKPRNMLNAEMHRRVAEHIGKYDMLLCWRLLRGGRTCGRSERNPDKHHLAV